MWQPWGRLPGKSVWIVEDGVGSDLSENDALQYQLSLEWPGKLKVLPFFANPQRHEENLNLKECVQDFNSTKLTLIADRNLNLVQDPADFDLLDPNEYLIKVLTSAC